MQEKQKTFFLKIENNVFKFYQKHYFLHESSSIEFLLENFLVEMAFQNNKMKFQFAKFKKTFKPKLFKAFIFSLSGVVTIWQMWVCAIIFCNTKKSLSNDSTALDWYTTF